MNGRPTYEWLVRRFADRQDIPDAYDAPPPRVEASRGDHSLNPGMSPITPTRPAAVLVPIVDRDSGCTVLLTRRTAHLVHHAGQISFPGGHIEPHDGGPVETALRETEEEVGLDRKHIAIIGHLDLYVTRTGFYVTPVVGLIEPPFDICPDSHEVAEVFEVPLAFLMDPCNHHRCSAEFDGVTRHFYAMPFGHYFIWGATAGMLMNLYQVLCEH